MKWIAAAINGSDERPGLKQRLDEIIAKLTDINERLLDKLVYDEDEEAEA